MIVGNVVVHQGVPPEEEFPALHKKLFEEQQRIAAAEKKSVSSSLKTSAYQQDMITNK
jgi:hypothetical protein